MMNDEKITTKIVLFLFSFQTQLSGYVFVNAFLSLFNNRLNFVQSFEIDLVLFLLLQRSEKI